MDDQRVGVAFRAVRVRRGWTQKQLAVSAGLSPSAVSLIERGHLDRLSLHVLRRMARKLDIRLDVIARWRGGDMDRLINSGHAALHEELARFLDQMPGWVQSPEVSYSIYGERGVIDILAFHEPTGSLLVIELKTEMVSLEDLLTAMDRRMRLAATIARDRGWKPVTVSGWVVIAEGQVSRRRARPPPPTLRSAFPADGRRIRGWLRNSSGTIRALSFWSISNGSGAKQLVGSRKRVRNAKTSQMAA